MQKREPIYKIGDAFGRVGNSENRYIIRSILNLVTYPGGEHLAFMYGCSVRGGIGGVRYSTFAEHEITALVKDGWVIEAAKVCSSCALYRGEGVPCEGCHSGTYSRCDACELFCQKED